MGNAAPLVARVLLAQIFVMSGMSKLGAGYIGTVAYMQAFGVPGFLLPFVIALEIGCGLAIIVGFFTRWAAIALAAFCVVSALIFHSHLPDPTQAVLFMKDFAIAGGLMLLALYGPGRYAVEPQPRRWQEG